MRSGFTQTAYLCTIDRLPLLIPHSLLANDRLLWGRWESRKRPKRYRLFIWSQTLLCGDHHYNHIDRLLTVRRGGLTHWLAGSTGKTNMKLCQKSTKMDTNTISKLNYKNNKNTKTTRSTIDCKIGLNKWRQIQIQMQIQFKFKYKHKQITNADIWYRLLTVRGGLTQWLNGIHWQSSPPLHMVLSYATSNI